MNYNKYMHVQEQHVVVITSITIIIVIIMYNTYINNLIYMLTINDHICMYKK